VTIEPLRLFPLRCEVWRRGAAHRTSLSPDSRAGQRRNSPPRAPVASVIGEQPLSPQQKLSRNGSKSVRRNSDKSPAKQSGENDVFVEAGRGQGNLWFF